MNFHQSEKKLKEIFDNNNYRNKIKENKRNVDQVEIDSCSNGTKISISFPGYKAKIKGEKIVYDYRVNISKNELFSALSHTNIIADIYNKITNGNRLAPDLKSILIDFFAIGYIDFEATKNRLDYDKASPSENFLSIIKNAHNGKSYNEKPNLTDLTIEELFKSIKWIVLQEDINYPIPRYEGRKMPLARYIETIFVTHNNAHSLEEVINRTIAHAKPPRWKEIDYSFLEKIQ